MSEAGLAPSIRSLVLYRKSLLSRDLYFRLKRLLSGDFAEREVQGSIMRLDLRDGGISKELLLDGIRERESTGTIKKVIRDGDVVADIGSNIGYYALMESLLIGNNGLVYAIEPVRKNFDSLTENIRMNGYTNIQAFALGIGDRECMADINISKKCNWNTMANTDKIDPTGTTERIELTTLDRFLKGRKKPNFVRMDVEGYERNVLDGMPLTLVS